MYENMQKSQQIVLERIGSHVDSVFQCCADVCYVIFLLKIFRCVTVSPGF